MIQSPCRALLADISGDNDAMVTIGNALFASFMAVGNIMGYAAGSFANLHLLFPFVRTEACDENCADIKTCFLLSVLLTSLIITLVVVFIKEERLDPFYLEYLQDGFHTEEKQPYFLMQIITAARSTSKPIRILYIVTALNWIGFFPFLLYNTDWMGREVYGGKAEGNWEQIILFSEGVREGSMGLMLYVVTMGCVSLFMESLIRFLGNVRRLWSIGNFILALCMGLTVVISAMTENARKADVIARGTSLVPPPLEVRVSCFALFGLCSLGYTTSG